MAPTRLLRRAARAAARLVAVLALLLPAPAEARQAARDRFAGHWAGTIQLPGQPLAFDVDLVAGPAGYTGDISIPAQNAKDVPLAGVVVTGDSIRFTLPGIPGEPTWAGVLLPDGRSIAGTFAQGGGRFPFALQAGPSPAEAAREALRGFDRWVDSALTAWKVVGAGVGIVVDGQLVYSRGHGFRDRERGLAATPRTLFAIGSSSKAFTTFAMGSLVDQGRLEWDKPVRTWLPGFRLHDPSASDRVTPRDLVTHRSGLPRHDLVWYNNTTASREELVARLAHLPASRDLREAFQYNNLMFLAAGHLVGTIMGTNWEEAVRTLVFQPLGMASSNFSVRALESGEDAARGYTVRRDSVVRMPYRNIDLVGPAGSINSSVEDMARWVTMHLAGGMVGGTRVISPATLRDMYAPYTPIGPLPTDKELGTQNYGLGWFVTSYRGRQMVHHGGNIDGFSALVALFPGENTGLVVLTNQNGAPLPMLLVRHAADRIFQLPPRDWNGEALAARARAERSNRDAEARKDSVRVPGTRPSHPLADYAGEYGHPGYGALAITRAGDSLAATYNGITTPLEHWHYDVFSGKPARGADPTFTDMKFAFRGDFKGNIAAVVAPFEPAVDPIVFTRQPDRQMRDPAWLQRFVGRYQLPDAEVRVTLRGTVLVAAVGNQPPFDLVPDRGTEFNLKGLAGFAVEFVPGPDGRVREARFKQPNGVFVARRAAP